MSPETLGIMSPELVGTIVVPFAMLLCGILYGTATVTVSDSASGMSWGIDLPLAIRAAFSAIIVTVLGALLAASFADVIRLDFLGLAIAVIWAVIGWALVYLLFRAAIAGTISPVRQPLLDLFPMQPAPATKAHLVI